MMMRVEDLDKLQFGRVLHQRPIDRIEQLLKAQADIRALYRSGKIDAAIKEFNERVSAEFGAADPRISKCALRLARSFIEMVDQDLAAVTVQPGNKS